MTAFKRWLVWLSRIHKCQGFGIQSPTDFDFVRTVVNEHSPYYAYDHIKASCWHQRHLGQLYLRIANWRQPSTILTDDYLPWFQAGCRSARILSNLGNEPLQLARIEIEQHAQLEQFYTHCNQQSVIIVEGIFRDWEVWHAIEHDERTGTTFDLYYCGIVFVDTQRFKHNYRINF
jgi:hypothetical protein